MALNDVWRSISEEVGFYYSANFDEVPAGPGVYAWFYPLRVLSKSADDLEQFARTVQAVLNYDALNKDAQMREAQLPMSWWAWSLRAARIPKTFQLSSTLKDAWELVVKDDALFRNFQECLLKASIFMPPLYVGKANNLSVRCAQHLAGAQGANDFHGRFEEYARRSKVPICSVRQLIFACVRTGAAAEEEAQSTPGQVHELVESIMKSICAPPYGIY